MHGAQDSSSFILLHEHSKVFKIIYTNCPGNVCPANVCPGKWLSEKRLVREIIDELGHAVVRETSFRETSCPGIVLSGKGLVRETSVRESDCPGNVRYPDHLACSTDVFQIPVLQERKGCKRCSNVRKIMGETRKLKDGKMSQVKHYARSKKVDEMEISLTRRKIQICL